MIHFRLDEWSRVYDLYQGARIYPIKVSEGHLLNLRILKTTSEHQPPFNIPLLECLLYASIYFHNNKPRYDIYWGQQYLQLTPEKHIVEIATGFDLLCNIQIQGGTYAAMGQKKFIWKPALKRWVLPQLTQPTPLYLLGKEGVQIDTDGEAIYARVGIVGNHQLRSKMNKATNNQYVNGETWY